MKTGDTMKVGVIGYGSRMHDVLRYLCKLHHEVSVAAIVDPRQEEIVAHNKTLSETRLLENFGKNYSDIVFYDTVDEMLDTAGVDGVLIGTRCNTHTDLAIQAMKWNLPLFLEKPVCTSIDQVRALYKASLDYKSEAVVSFPLRMSLTVRRTRELIEAGEIGKVHQIQAVYHVAGGAGYFSRHYRDFEETGGLWLQKATHDLDYMAYVVGSRPTRVASMHSVHQVFGGDKPAGLTCDRCDEFETCPESPFFNYLQRAGGDVMGKRDTLCVFGEDVGRLEDHGSCILEYENGAQGSYSQNFYIRNRHARGATVIGYDGNIYFDFGEGKVILTKHHSPEVHTIEVGGVDGHGGGDSFLASNFMGIMRGTEGSKAPLLSGIESAYLCLLCRESAERGEFLPVQPLA